MLKKVISDAQRGRQTDGNACANLEVNADVCGRHSGQFGHVSEWRPGTRKEEGGKMVWCHFSR